VSPTAAPPRPPTERPDVQGLPHPRMRERQIDVARAAGRKRLRRINVVLGAVCLLVWVAVVLRSPFLDVDRIEVSGASSTSEATVLAASGVDRGDAMVEVDLARVRARVSELPWVDDVVVSRTWPGTVRIGIEERRAVAAATHPDGWAVLDATGRVLAVSGSRPSLVRIDAAVSAVPGGSAPAEVAEVAEVVAGVPPVLADEMVSAAVGPDGVEVELRDGYVVVLGDASVVEDKVASAVAVRDHVEPEDGCRIDARVPRAPVLTAGGHCA